MTHYVYLTTNIINGKRYVGDHSTEDIHDGYIGSGKIFTKAVKKYGKKNFRKQILEHFESKIEAFKAQEKYIEKFDTLFPHGYNLSPKGGFGLQCFHSEYTKEQMRLSHKGMEGKNHSQETIEKMKESHSNMSNETKEKMKNAKIGKHRSEETKQKISNYRKSCIGIKRGPYNKNK